MDIRPIYVKVGYRSGLPAQDSEHQPAPAAVQSFQVGYLPAAIQPPQAVYSAQTAGQSPATCPAVPAAPVATVKFQCPDGPVITQAWSLVSRIVDLKKSVAELVQVSDDLLTVCYQGNEVADEEVTLQGLGVKVNDTVTFDLWSSRPDMYPIRCREKRGDLLPLPDVITVRVRDSFGKLKDVVVEIENRCIRQPFLGGWKWNKSGMKVLHAQTQTDYSVQANNQVIIVDSNDGPSCNNIQVCTGQDKANQTLSDVACQASRLHMSIRSTRDVLVTPGTYITAEHSKAAMRDYNHIQAGYQQPEPVTNPQQIDHFIRHLEQVDAAAAAPLGDDSNCELLNSTPNSKGDIACWRQLRHGGQIGSLPSSAAKDQLMLHLLQQVSRPKVWQSATGKQVQVDTVEGEHLRKLADMYSAMCTATLPEQRVAAIAQLKQILLSNETCPSACIKEIVQLADRELELLSRHLMASNLTALQSRLRHLLRKFISSQMPS